MSIVTQHVAYSSVSALARRTERLKPIVEVTAYQVRRRRQDLSRSPPLSDWLPQWSGRRDGERRPDVVGARRMAGSVVQ
jgi:hypothetical protein